jgi:hypothetical protein
MFTVSAVFIGGIFFSYINVQEIITSSKFRNKWAASLLPLPLVLSKFSNLS